MTRSARLGITGGIGSGKSYVAHLLTEQFGIPVYDCDAEARRLMTASSSIRQQLIALLGRDVYQPDGQLNKEVVSRYLFASPEHARHVNAIVHPAVKADFLLWAGRQTGVVAMESAILLEAGFRDVVDYLLVVQAPEELRLCRVEQRDAASAVQVRQRMALQTDDATRLAAADEVLYNDGRPLLPQLHQIILHINSNNVKS